MSSSLAAFTKLLVADPAATARFYEGLGFTQVGTDGTFHHLRWETGGDVMLARRPSGVHFPAQVGLGVLVGFVAHLGLDVLAERASALGASTQGPSVQPWNTRELVVTDPNGYRLNFIEPVQPPE